MEVSPFATIFVGRYGAPSLCRRFDPGPSGTERITQYLRPSERHHPVERWFKPEEFVMLEPTPHQIGFLGVMSGPLVPSSYRAGRLHAQVVK